MFCFESRHVVWLLHVATTNDNLIVTYERGHCQLNQNKRVLARVSRFIILTRACRAAWQWIHVTTWPGCYLPPLRVSSRSFQDACQFVMSVCINIEQQMQRIWTHEINNLVVILFCVFKDPWTSIVVYNGATMHFLLYLT